MGVLPFRLFCVILLYKGDQGVRALSMLAGAFGGVSGVLWFSGGDLRGGPKNYIYKNRTGFESISGLYIKGDHRLGNMRENAGRGVYPFVKTSLS